MVLIGISLAIILLIALRALYISDEHVTYDIYDLVILVLIIAWGFAIMGAFALYDRGYEEGYKQRQTEMRYEHETRRYFQSQHTPDSLDHHTTHD